MFVTYDIEACHTCDIICDIDMCKGRDIETCHACDIDTCRACDIEICHVCDIMTLCLQGRHVVKDDITTCPNCDFPALLSEFLRSVASQCSHQ